MSGVTWWHRALVYLGLKEEPDEAYEERRPPATAEDGASEPETAEPAPVRGDVRVRPLRPAGDAETTDERPSVRAAVVEIRSFEDVESVGARYRTGQPVLFDATAGDADTARRVLDFVSGMTYVSQGDIAKVGSRAFLLVPGGVRLPGDERRRLSGLGYRVETGSDS